MNITEPEYTTKADVVVDTENPDQKPEDKNRETLKDPIHVDSVEVRREEQLTPDENPLEFAENSEQENEALIADTNQSLRKGENPLVVDPNQSTTLQVLEPASSTTAATKREESEASSLVENIIDTILDAANTSVIHSDLGNNHNTQEDINNHQSSKNTTEQEKPSENNSSEQEISNLDLLTVKYTTIFLRLFAPESTTTAEPKVGHVQQELPGEKPRPDENNAQKQNPAVLDNPRPFDAGRQVNTTSSPSVTPPIPTTSLSTKYTTTTTAPAVFSSVPPKSPLELDSTNGK